ncbi:T9SS type A sorting domain-containing protein [bacterium]|nr:T9SS type A sorting domain-containing protein [bacterium]NUN46669.1 T9SS type A sorting domain-containing protein [bacterium]
MKSCFVVVFTFIFGWGLRPLSAQVLTADSVALVNLYDSTGGTNWTTKTNWKTGPVSSWFGVTVGGNRVTAIDLNNNNLTGRIPVTLGTLGSLISLQLYGNAITNTIPSSLGNLTNLANLGLENNQLSGQIPPSLGNLNAMTDLTLNNNAFTDSIPVTFRNLAALQNLEVQNNRLSVFPDLSNIGTLTSLNLSGNKFTFEDIQPNVGIATFTYSGQDSLDSYASVSSAEASSRILVVTAGGANNQYSWKKNNVAIPSTNNDTLYIDSVKTSDAGNYTCDVTNTVAIGTTLRRKVITLTVTGTAPSTPTGVTASGVTTNRIDVAWNKPSGVITRYRVYRSTTAASGYVQVDSVAAPTLTYSNTSLSSNTVYFYKISSVGNFGFSAQSSTASDTTHSVAPIVANAIPDTSLFEGFGKTFRRKLTHVFSDADNTTLTYSVSTTPAELTATISHDTLYIASVAGFSGTAAVVASAFDGYSTVTDTFNVTYILDVTAPTISNVTLPASVASGASLTVTATVTDNGSLSGVKLFFQKGTSAYDSLTMTAGTNNTFTATVHDSNITTEGIALYIRARDSRVNTAISDTSSVPVTFTTVASSLAGSKYPTGIPSNRWRLVSVPADLDSKNLSSILSGVYSGDYIAYNAQPAEITALANGAGMWFYHKSPVDMPINTAAGKTNLTTGFDMSLAPGWNLIGNPYPFTINFAALEDTAFYGPIEYGVGATEAWSTEVTTLQPFGGYAIYVKGNAARTIRVTPDNFVWMPKSSNQLEGEKFRIMLSAEGLKKQIRYGDLYTTLAVLDRDDAEAFAQPEPKNPGQTIGVYFPSGDHGLNRKTIRFDKQGITSDFVLESGLESGELTMQIVNNEPGWSVRLFNVSTNSFIDHETAMSLPPSGTKWLMRILAGTPEYLAGKQTELEQLPKAFELQQNYPNPFNPGTTIRYALASQAKVTLTVYNMLGQKVRTLVNGDRQETGLRTAAWDGRDERGALVSSGVYLYRVELETTTGLRKSFTRKMLLVK